MERAEARKCLGPRGQSLGGELERCRISAASILTGGALRRTSSARNLRGAKFVEVDFRGDKRRAVRISATEDSSARIARSEPRAIAKWEGTRLDGAGIETANLDRRRGSPQLDDNGLTLMGNEMKTDPRYSRRLVYSRAQWAEFADGLRTARARRGARCTRTS